MHKLYFPLATHIIGIILLIIFFRKPKIDNKETKIFGYMLVISFIESALSITVQVFTYKYFENVVLYNKILMILNKFYFVFMLSWIMLLLLYMININHKEEIYEKYKRLLFYFHFTILPVILLLPLNVIEFKGQLDVAGVSVTLLYSIIITYIFIASVVLFNNIKKISEKSLPFFIFIIMMLVTFLLRFILPGIDLASSVIVYVNLIMLHTIENPDLKLLKEMENAKKMAEQANNYKTSFLANMSHEIRTPLNAIVGLSELNTMEKDINILRNNSEDILSASNILLDIVGNILDISKIETGEVEVHNSKYNIYEVTDVIKTLILPKVREKNLRLYFHVAPGIPELYGDKNNLKKVLLNLLSNAVKYTKEGTITFKLDFYTQNDICRFIISVEDTGIGIKQSEYNKLFEKFFRADVDKNTTIEGTGLGLAITKSIVESMNGDISVQSVYGSGSKFTVTLNQKIHSNKISNNMNSTKNKENKLLFKNKKVLVVDDNKLNLKVAEKFLKLYNLEVDLADSAEEGFKLINNNKYDLYILDQMMPNMTGTEMMRILKDKKDPTPTIVLTADVESKSESNYLKEGFDGYLKKPIERHQLEKKLKSFLK